MQITIEFIRNISLFMMTILIHRSDDSNRFNDLQRQLSTTKANAEARTKAKHNYNTI